MTSHEILRTMKGRRALVVGDLMLDEYIFGRATRISPEAPVMVVRQQRTKAVPGGAANVARNLAALGADTSVVGVIGDDDAGRALQGSLGAAGIPHPGIVVDASRPTTRKTRVLADAAHQVLRIDEEDERPLDGPIADRLCLTALVHAENAQVIVISDYLKGTVTQQVAEAVIAFARKAGIPIVVNPKPASLSHYRGATLVSLNRTEAAQATGWSELAGFGTYPESSDLPRRAAQFVRDSLQAEHVLVTMGEHGMWTEDLEIPAPRVDVFDTAGAGDTTIATVALGLAAVGYRREVFELAALTSALVVQKVGVAVPTSEDLANL